LDAFEEKAAALVYCKCSVRSLGNRYLEEADLLGIHLHNFDKDISAFECVTAADAPRPEQEAEPEH